MKIGIDARLWNETGVGRYIRNLYRYLPELDKKNEYVWFFMDKEYDEIKLSSKKWRKVRANVRWHSLSEQLLMPVIFMREGLDLLHFPYFSFPILYPGKFVIHIYDLIYDHYKIAEDSTLPRWLFSVKMLGYRLITWIAMKRAAAVMTLSEDAKSEIIDHYHIDSKNIFITYEAGELENRTSISGENRNKIKKFKPYIMYVGSAHPHKNVENLVLSLKEMVKSRKNIKLVLIGNDNFFYPRLKRFVHRCGLTNRVIFVGSVPNGDLSSWYQSALALVSASRMEGFGIPPLEAMSVGCPVLLSDMPIFREICGDSAIYFDQNNPKNIAETIGKTIFDQELIKKMVKKGYRQASLYSWKNTIKETIKIYEKCK